jgi:FlaA1/EpsC-like NDP-sugar epimerase
MASSEGSQRLSALLVSVHHGKASLNEHLQRGSRGANKVWMLLDGITILVAAVLATLYKLHTGPLSGARDVWHGAMIHGRSMWIILAFLFGFGCALNVTSRRLNLYSPIRLSSFLHEQRLSLQACLTSGLLVTGTLYLVRDDDIPRAIVLITVVLVALLIGLRRLVYRILLYRRFDHGKDTRNVLIVGTGPDAHVLRQYLDSIQHLGYAFKGFIDSSGGTARFAVPSEDVLCCLDKLFQCARLLFVDEILFTNPYEPGMMPDVLKQARLQGVNLRVVPDLYYGLASNSSIEYIGQFPTIPLRCAQVPKLRLLFKRVSTPFSS